MFTAAQAAHRSLTLVIPCSHGGADSSVQSEDIKGWENGKVLSLSKDKKYIILNPALKAGDKVLLLRVQRGQKFVVLSRVYEGVS